MSSAAPAGVTWRSVTEEPDGWRPLGICAQRDEDPEMWTTAAAGPRRAATHRCREHCPVFAECGTFVAPSMGVVIAGVAYGERSAKPLKPDPKVDLERCPRCESIDTPGRVG